MKSSFSTRGFVLDVDVIARGLALPLDSMLPSLKNSPEGNILGYGGWNSDQIVTSPIARQFFPISTDNMREPPELPNWYDGKAFVAKPAYYRMSFGMQGNMTFEEHISYYRHSSWKAKVAPVAVALTMVTTLLALYGAALVEYIHPSFILCQEQVPEGEGGHVCLSVLHDRSDGPKICLNSGYGMAESFRKQSTSLCLVEEIC